MVGLRPTVLVLSWTFGDISWDRMSAHAWGPGHVIAGRYQLQSPLGQGGMGSVWRALHLSLRSPVAIKLLNPAIADDPEILERFLREAQSAAALRGAYVVQIFDYGVEDGIPYIAMEMLQGESLADRIEGGRPFSGPELAKIFGQVGRAVSKAHEAGIIHRDLKPDNIFLVSEGDEEVAKVLDFGIAKIAEGSLTGSSGRGTRTGAMMGTPYYMSPEQAQGNKAVDHRSDLWALAVIAYECMTKQRPFTSDALGDLVIQICMREPVPPSRVASVPAGFDQWFLRGCAKDPSQRFQTARELAETLAGCLNGTQPLAFSRGASASGDQALDRTAPHMLTTHSAAAASIPALSQSTPKLSSRQSAFLAVALAVAAVVVVGAVLFIRFFDSPDAASEAAPQPTLSVATPPLPQEDARRAPLVTVPSPVTDKLPEVPPPSAVTAPTTSEKPVKAAAKRTPRAAVRPGSPPPVSTPVVTGKPVPPADSDLFSGRK